MRSVNTVRDLRRWARLARRFGNRTALEAVYLAVGTPYGFTLAPPPAPQPSIEQLESSLQGTLRALPQGDPSPITPGWMPPVDPWPIEMLRDIVPVAVGLVATLASLALVVVVANFFGNGPVSDLTMLDWSSRFAVALLIASIAGFCLILVPQIFKATDPDLRKMVLVSTAIAGFVCAIVIYLIEGTKAETSALNVVLLCVFVALAIGSFIAFARSMRN